MKEADKTLKFVTLHPKGEKVDLIKDEGQIPYILFKNYGVDAMLVTCGIDNSIENQRKVPGLKIKKIPFLFNSVITGLVYLLFNSKNIDWLNIYFAGRQALYWSKFYKLLNPNGKIYLKLDMDFRSVELYDKSVDERIVFKKNTEIADIVSVESMKIKSAIQKYSSKEILLIKNGVAKSGSDINICQNRKNVFLTVGRLGTQQKATDVLLEAFARSSNNHDWNLKLIGNVEDDFQQYISLFFERYPHLKSRITFVGSIDDRNKLYNEYCKSKIFVLPSRWESFGISSVEAMICGCRLILTEGIPPANEMTNNGKYGSIVRVDDIEQLAEELSDATKITYHQESINEISEYANSTFSWELIVEKLYDRMIILDTK